MSQLDAQHVIKKQKYRSLLLVLTWTRAKYALYSSGCGSLTISTSVWWWWVVTDSGSCQTSLTTTCWAGSINKRRPVTIDWNWYDNHISCGFLVDERPLLKSFTSKLKNRDLPGQDGSPWHGTVSVSDPGQSLPPLDGGGLLHSLVLVKRPLPQLAEQAPSTNGDQLPSTGGDK